MTEVHSTDTSRSRKPAQPSDGFPNFAHATKRRAKKINGRMRCFGPWGDPQAALQAYQDFLAGKPVLKDSTPGQSNGRPAKPYPTFPLFPHASGRWAKKILGKTHYLGPWNDADAAMKKCRERKEDVHAGWQESQVAAGVTLKDLCHTFLNTKQAKVDVGELAQRSWRDYKAACELLVNRAQAFR